MWGEAVSMSSTLGACIDVAVAFSDVRRCRSVAFDGYVRQCSVTSGNVPLALLNSELITFR